MAGVGQRLEMRQGQSLVMTPQLQQAIKLLQLSNIELTEYCETELEKNPLLERDDSAPREAERESLEPIAASERADESLNREDFSKVSELDQAAHDNMYDGGTASSGPSQNSLSDWTQVKSGGSFDSDEDGFESTLTDGGTLK